MEYRTKKTEASSVKLSDKMLQIIECLADNWMPMRLLDISTKLKMNQPTVLRYLNSLVHSKYVYQEEDTLRYGLTMKLCKLAHQLSSNLGIRVIASPYLNRLSKTLNVSSCLVIENANKVLYLDLAEMPGAVLTTFMHIGKEAPLHATGSGKVLLSAYSEQQFNEFVETQGLKKLTPNTITAKESLAAEINHIRLCGYAVDHEECQLGLRCVAVPVYNFTDCVVAALSVFDQTGNLSEERIEHEILPEINKAQQAISMRMGSSIQPTYTICSS